MIPYKHETCMAIILLSFLKVHTILSYFIFFQHTQYFRTMKCSAVFVCNPVLDFTSPVLKIY